MGPARGRTPAEVLFVKNVSPAFWLGAAMAASAAAVLFEPAMYFYLVSHQDSPSVLHHANNLGSLLIALVLFAGLSVVAGLSAHPPLRRAATLSVSVTAVNVVGNEYSLLSGADPSWLALALYGILYAGAGALFTRAFLGMSSYLGTIATALGAVWAISAAVNLLVSLSVGMADEETFWIGLNGAVGLSALVHILMVFLFGKILREMKERP